MNTTPIKILENITTQFSKFNTNQVLTENQLNEFLDYFKDQDHLTRIGLSGVGNACGFKIELRDADIKITNGFGVTTDGDLITLPRKVINIEGETGDDITGEVTNIPNLLSKFEIYTHYRDFVDDKVGYKKFIRNNEQIELFELIPKDLVNQLDPVPNSLNDLPTLKEMVVLLYLENYEKDPEACDKTGCNNQGLEQVARLKVLLLSQEDASYLANNDALFSKHNFYELHKNLPDINAKRIILTNKNTSQLRFIKQQYSNAIAYNESLNKLIEGYATIYDKFEIPQIATPLFELLSLPSPTSDFQYRYDLFKDLIATYNEIKDLLLHINVECCPSIGAFPKHLLLGKLTENKKFKTLRHQFYKSPIVGHEETNYKKVMLLIKRATQLVYSYNIGIGEIRITPSNELTPLSDKAIPFYYNVDNNLLNSWSYKKTSNFNEDTNLSYHVEKLKDVDIIQNPLEYNIDQNDFYRIEGHQGKMYRDALDNILNLKENFGLNFDVKVLPINPTNQSINIDDYQCEFEELSMLLNAWRTEQNCILSDMSRFFSGFQTNNAGSNLVAENAGYQELLIADVEAVDTTTVTTETGTVTTDTVTTGIDAVITDTSGTISTAEINNDFFDVSTDVGHTAVGTSGLHGINLENTNINYKAINNNFLNYQANIGGFSNKNKIRGNNQFLSNKIKGDNSELAFNLQNNINIVEKELTKDDNTIGKYLNEAILENKNGSANDIYISFIDKTVAIRDSEIWTTEPDLTDFIFNDISTALIHSYVLDDKIPNHIIDIDHLTIGKYKLTIEELCNKVKILQARYQNKKLKNGTKEILGLVINQLATVCCSGKKLEILLAEIERRKQKILTQLQFSEFVKKHPGLEHKAGVKSGGTFIMAYLLDNAIDQSTYETVRMELNFLEQPNIDDDGTDGDEGRIKLWSERVSTNFAFLHKVTSETQNPAGEIVIIGNTIEQTVANLVAFLNRIWRRAGAQKYCKASSEGRKLIIEITDRLVEENKNHILFFNPAIVGVNTKIYFSPNEIIRGNVTNRNTVVADFSLPYMCCSDCSTVNFIIPKEPVFLSLPDAFVCLTDELLPIPFTVSPIDGEVKAKVNLGLNGGVVNIDNNYYFDAKIIDESLYGQEILFTVNDEETDSKVIVYKKPEIIIDRIITYNEGKTQATIVFTIVGQLGDDITYTWNLGNGTTSNEAPNSDGNFTYIYDLPVNETNTITPSLTLSNGYCNNVYDIETIVFDDPINVNLVIVNSVCIDPQSDVAISIPFTSINPPSGDIQLVQQNISGIEVLENTLKITPNVFNAFESQLTFKINGISTTANITVHEKTAVSITNEPSIYSFDGETLFQEYVFNAITPDNVAVNELVFTWSIDNVPVGTGQQLTHAFALNPEGNNFDIKLKVTNANGCVTDVFIAPFSIIYPEIQIKITDDSIKDLCINDKIQYPIIVQPTIEGIVLNGLGVSQNTNGDNIFTPNTTGLEVNPNTLTIQTTINFLTQALFTIKLHDTNVSFTIDESVVNEITLESTSLGLINSFKWLINGVEVNDSDDGNVGIHKIILDQSSPTSWNFGLIGQSQFCGEVTSVLQTSNAAYVPENVNLVIAESDKCINIIDEFITVGFTTIEPSGGTITINEPIPSGMSIVNNQLEVIVSSFDAFEQVVGFSLNGINSTATIIMHQPKAISIGLEKGVNMFWEGDILKRNIIIDAVIPVEIDDAATVYNWKINNEVVASTGKTLNENKTLFGGSNTFRIDLTVVDQNGCVSVAVKKSINIDYPNFQIIIEGGAVEYCAKDTNPYSISILPVIEGTVVNDVSGAPITTFVPFNTTPDSNGNVVLSIAGNPELTVHLNKAPNAAFTPFHDAKLNQIRLTNNSTGAINGYQWFINGVESVEGVTAEDNYLINLTQSSPSVWDFKLVAKSSICDDEIAEVFGFTASFLDGGGIQGNCATITEEELNNIKASFVNGELQGGDNTNVGVPTVKMYTTVLTDFLKFSRGDFNNDLINLFNKNNEINIFDITTAAIIKQAANEAAKQILLKYFNAQIALFFDILKCQDPNFVIERDRVIIDSIIEIIRLDLGNLKGRNILNNNNLITFLTNYANVSKFGFIKNVIGQELIPLLKK